MYPELQGGSAGGVGGVQVALHAYKSTGLGFLTGGALTLIPHFNSS